jgi:hypothetical protein
MYRDENRRVVTGHANSPTQSALPRPENNRISRMWG